MKSRFALGDKLKSEYNTSFTYTVIELNEDEYKIQSGDAVFDMPYEERYMYLIESSEDKRKKKQEFEKLWV